MKKLDVCGIGNGIVDIFADISEEHFSQLAFERGSMRLVDVTEQRSLLRSFGTAQPAMVSGGSVANSVIALAQLGGTGAICCHLADDEYGRFYRDECKALGLHVPVPLKQEGSTATCVVLVTPDAERTMRTALGVSAELAPEHIDSSVVSDAKWLFLEGYLLSNSDNSRQAVYDSVSMAKAAGTKVAVTCSDAWVVNGFAAPMERVLSGTDLIFANEEEAHALAGTKDILSAGATLSQRFPHVVITAGPKGAYLWWEGEQIHVPAFPCQPRDLTGAGDMFAGAFLYGMTHGLRPYDAAHRACFLAREVISQVGARLPGDVRGLWGSVG